MRGSRQISHPQRWYLEGRQEAVEVGKLHAVLRRVVESEVGVEFVEHEGNGLHCVGLDGLARAPHRYSPSVGSTSTT
jgi:hypothetical protein